MIAVKVRSSGKSHPSIFKVFQIAFGLEWMSIVNILSSFVAFVDHSIESTVPSCKLIQILEFLVTTITILSAIALVKRLRYI
jgi:hypothetical protein